ncbi:helix-turn-helix transcriptional regulator [Oscillibacter sp.]|uniref:helix-turn-helix transcriptional regulator n=1 Tax=Oscillibacter sp. TaxID=1945593 RepID=UPI00338D83C2
MERKEPEPAEEPEDDLEDAVPDWQAQREKFGSRLRKAREETGLDRAAFAERIGAYKATYSAWENGSLPGGSQFPGSGRWVSARIISTA